MSKIWIKSPGPNGGCSECSDQTGPCDEGGCVFFNPIQGYDGIAVYPNLLAAQSFLSNGIFNCFAKKITERNNTGLTISNPDNTVDMLGTLSLRLDETSLIAQMRFFSKIKLSSSTPLSFNGLISTISVRNYNVSISLANSNYTNVENIIDLNGIGSENNLIETPVSQNSRTIDAGEYILDISLLATFFESVRGVGVAPHAFGCDLVISPDLELCRIKAKYYDDLEIKVLECT